jgi:hypothetical protein
MARLFSFIFIFCFSIEIVGYDARSLRESCSQRFPASQTKAQKVILNKYLLGDCLRDLGLDGQKPTPCGRACLNKSESHYDSVMECAKSCKMWHKKYGPACAAVTSKSKDFSKCLEISTKSFSKECIAPCTDLAKNIQEEERGKFMGYCLSECPKQFPEGCGNACSQIVRTSADAPIHLYAYEFRNCLQTCPKKVSKNCAKECTDFTSGAELSGCLWESCMPEKKRICKAICLTNRKDSMSYRQCMDQCPRNVHPKCVKACQKNTVSRPDVIECLNGCEHWTKDCGSACSDVSKSGKDLVDCLKGCSNWRSPCGKMCKKKAKTGKGLAKCLTYCNYWRESCAKPCMKESRSAVAYGKCFQEKCVYQNRY